ncbi:hypothetical protein AB0D08_31775 [Kitasatospora sp. NPDC048540]
MSVRCPGVAPTLAGTPYWIRPAPTGVVANALLDLDLNLGLGL